MTLYEQWDEYGADLKSQDQYKQKIEAYLDTEKDVYEYILSNRDQVVEGTIRELGKQFYMDDVEFVGFVDGINASLIDGYELESLTADSVVRFEIDYKKLYWNMLDANAKWLYNLEQWDAILSKEERIEMRKEYNRSKIVIKDKKIGRNEPCTCGSGKKYKRCCGK